MAGWCRSPCHSIMEAAQCPGCTLLLAGRQPSSSCEHGASTAGSLAVSHQRVFIQGWRGTGGRWRAACNCGTCTSMVGSSHHQGCAAHLRVGRGRDGGQLAAGPLPDELVELLCLLQLALGDGGRGGDGQGRSRQALQRQKDLRWLFVCGYYRSQQFAAGTFPLGLTPAETPAMDWAIRCIGVFWWHRTLMTLRDGGLPTRAAFSRLPFRPRAPTFEEATCITITCNLCPHPHRHPERRISTHIHLLTWHIPWGIHGVRHYFPDED